MRKAIRQHHLEALLVSAAVAVTIGGCGASSTARITAPTASRVAHWKALARFPRPLDVVGPAHDGSFVLAADRRLWRLSRGGTVRPLRIGGGGYRSPGGAEPYIALAPTGCFGAGNVYAIRLAGGPGIVAVNPVTGTRWFTQLRVPGLINGIAFDHTGAFGHRLLVTANSGAHTVVEAIGCHGTVTTISRRAPRVEGGIAVAPATFGRFAGDLIAPDEKSGRIFAITPNGTSVLVANSGLPYGPDTGVESEAFLPAGPAEEALVADRLTPRNPHPGDDRVLRIASAALKASGTRPGDLLVATEGGGLTDAISCSAVGCRVRLVAKGPAIAHIEGHIAFGRG